MSTRLPPADLREQEGGVVGPQHVRAVLAGGLARQALEQRVAGEVELQAGTVAAQREEDARVGVVHVDVGTTPGDLDKAVAQSVLHAQGGEVRVAQFIGGAARGDGEGGAGAQDVLPGNGARALVKAIGIAAVEARDGDEDAAGETRPQADAVCVGEPAGEGDPALEAADLACAELAKLVGKRDFEALGAARVELERRLVAGVGGRGRHGLSLPQLRSYLMTLCIMAASGGARRARANRCLVSWFAHKRGEDINEWS